MALTNLLDQLGTILTQITTLQPEYAVLLIGMIIALYKPLKKGLLDNRLDSLLEEIDYTTGVLTASFIVAYYYMFGMNIGQEIITIAGGFVIGTFVVRTFQKLTGFD